MIKKIITYIVVIALTIIGILIQQAYIYPNYGLDLRGGTEMIIQVDSKPYLQNTLKKNLKKIQSISNDAAIQDIKITFSSNEDINKITSFLKNINMNFIIKNNQYIAYLNDIHQIEKNLISNSIETIRSRIDPLGTKDISISQSDRDKIIIAVPGDTDLAYIESILNQKAELSFHFVTDPDEENVMQIYYKDSKDNFEYISEFSYITGDNLLNASPNINGSFQSVVSIKLDAPGAKTFSFMTKKRGKKLAIVIDNEILTAPTINDNITSGEAIITGFKSIEEASKIALFLKSGSLKANFKILQNFKIGPTIGYEAIKNTPTAALISILSVGALMIGAYGFMFGIVAILTIIFTLIILVFFMTSLNTTLTLFGIGGILATIGMCVDSNVLIFENIIEEKENQEINYIEKGFQNAWITIFDSNITTIIAAIALMVFGSSMIIGFAVTLIIGIFASLISAVYLSKEILIMVAGEGLEPPASRL